MGARRLGAARRSGAGWQCAPTGGFRGGRAWWRGWTGPWIAPPRTGHGGAWVGGREEVVRGLAVRAHGRLQRWARVVARLDGAVGSEATGMMRPLVEILGNLNKRILDKDHRPPNQHRAMACGRTLRQGSPMNNSRLGTPEESGLEVPAVHFVCACYPVGKAKSK